MTDSGKKVIILAFNLMFVNYDKLISWNESTELLEKSEPRLMDTAITDKDESISDLTKMEEIPVISSKWDQFGEDEDAESLLPPEDSAQKESKSADDSSQTSNTKSSVDKKVTSEVIKRAENAIFAKAISAISVGSSRSSSAARRSSPSQSSSSKRKVYIDNYEVPDSEKDEKSKGSYFQS